MNSRRVGGDNVCIWMDVVSHTWMKEKGHIGKLYKNEERAILRCGTGFVDIIDPSRELKNNPNNAFLTESSACPFTACTA